MAGGEAQDAETREVSDLIGAELAGVLGALGAIPVAGAIQVLLREWLSTQAGEGRAPPAATADSPS